VRGYLEAAKPEDRGLTFVVRAWSEDGDALRWRVTFDGPSGEQREGAGIRMIDALEAAVGNPVNP